MKKLGFVIAAAGLVALSAVTAQQQASFNPKTAKEILELTGTDYEVQDLTFSADGKRLAVAVDEGTARVWDVEAGRGAFQLIGHQYAVSSIKYTPDGKSLISFGDDDLLKTWDASTGKQTNSVNLKCNKGGNDDLEVMKDGRALVTCDGLKFVNPQSGKVEGVFKNAGLVYSLAMSPDGRTVLGSTGNAEFTMWDTQTLESFRTLKGHESQGFAVAYSPDGKLVATGASDETARLWNAVNGREVKVLKGHDGSVLDVAFSPDGKLLATASGDDTVKLWDTASGEELATLEGHKEDVTQLAWSKDGKMLASGDEGGIIKLWGTP